MRTTPTRAGIRIWSSHPLLLGASALVILGVAGSVFLLCVLTDTVSGAFLGSSTITIDGNITTNDDWGTTANPAQGIAVSQDANNDGVGDANANFDNTEEDINYFWMGVSTVSGGTTAPTTGNEVENFYFRIDTFETTTTLNQKYNIQLNLGTASAGFADHLLQIFAGVDGTDPEVKLVLYTYDSDQAIGAYTTGAITSKVANVSGEAPVTDNNATGGDRKIRRYQLRV